jgi:hypothetical protein
MVSVMVLKTSAKQGAQKSSKMMVDKHPKKQ